MDRRCLLTGAAALGAASILPARAFAQTKTLVAATFPGTWNEAHRNILAPAFRRATGATVTQSIILGTDQVARLQAAKGSRPPFDVAIFDSPQVLDAAHEGLIVEYPAAKSPHYAELLPVFRMFATSPRVRRRFRGSRSAASLSTTCRRCCPPVRNESRSFVRFSMRQTPARRRERL